MNFSAKCLCMYGALCAGRTKDDAVLAPHSHSKCPLAHGFQSILHLKPAGSTLSAVDRQPGDREHLQAIKHSSAQVAIGAEDGDCPVISSHGVCKVWLEPQGPSMAQALVKTPEEMLYLAGCTAVLGALQLSACLAQSQCSAVILGTLLQCRLAKNQVYCELRSKAGHWLDLSKVWGIGARLRCFWPVQCWQSIVCSWQGEWGRLPALLDSTGLQKAALCSHAIGQT